MCANKSGDEMMAERFGNDELPADFAARWRAEAISKSDRPEEFWVGQRMRIRGRVQRNASPSPRSLRFAIASAALIFFAVFLIAPAGPLPPQPTQHAVFDADQQLLLAVEHALAVGTPEALEPVTLLEATSNSDVETIPQQEHHHEN